MHRFYGNGTYFRKRRKGGEVNVTIKQRILLVLTALIFAAVLVLLVWFIRKPEEAPDGVLVYKEAYMRMAEQPWQGEYLCHSK